MPTKRAKSRSELKKQIKGRALSNNVVMGSTPRTPKIAASDKSPGTRSNTTPAQRISADIRRAWGKSRPVKIGQKRSK